MPYTVTVDAAVLDTYATASRRIRRELRKAIARLADDPYMRGDTRFRSDIGNDVERRQFAQWIVTYWSDHAVREVRIVDAERLR